MSAGLFRLYFQKVLNSILVSKAGNRNGGYSWLFSAFPQMFYIQLLNTLSSNSLKSMTQNHPPNGHRILCAVKNTLMWLYSERDNCDCVLKIS